MGARNKIVEYFANSISDNMLEYSNIKFNLIIVLTQYRSEGRSDTSLQKSRKEEIEKTVYGVRRIYANMYVH